MIMELNVMCLSLKKFLFQEAGSGGKKQRTRGLCEGAQGYHGDS